MVMYAHVTTAIDVCVFLWRMASSSLCVMAERRMPPQACTLNASVYMREGDVRCAATTAAFASKQPIGASCIMQKAQRPPTHTWLHARDAPTGTVLIVS